MADAAALQEELAAQVRELLQPPSLALAAIGIELNGGPHAPLPSVQVQKYNVLQRIVSAQDAYIKEMEVRRDAPRPSSEHAPADIGRSSVSIHVLC